MADLSRLITVAGLAECKSACGKTVFPISTVRGWISGNRYGFRDQCVVAIGEAVYIDLDALDRWVEARRGVRKTRATRATAPARRQRARGGDVAAFNRIAASL